ncbi:MAG TPA: GNAT family N-acetyltransferase [Pseudonocardiaceae bacterium]|nr:GNAT family N-acetyltransferase [Pseudonocardiaceae bacterium]
MLATQLLERQCADAWPAIVDQPLGQWRLRAAGGFTGRANSALTLGDPGLPVADALGRVQEFAAANAIPAVAHVVNGSPVEQDLVAAGWTVHQAHPGGAECAVMTGPLAGLAGPVPDGASVPEQPPDDWWPLAVDADLPSPAQWRVLAGRRDVGFGTVRIAGHVAGIVRGAVVGDLLHIARLAVAPEYRRRGLATGLLAALAEWGAVRGAVRCVLQVATHNTAAISLYAALGCRPHHHYRYWRPSG